MIEVRIRINASVIIHRCAVNVSPENGIEYGKGEQKYIVYDQLTDYKWKVTHVFEDGAAVLSKIILDLRPEEAENYGR